MWEGKWCKFSPKSLGRNELLRIIYEMINELVDFFT